MEILLINKKEIVGYCLVSSCDYAHLNQYKWHKNHDGYVMGTINNKPIRIHRYIMIDILENDITSQVKIDHINNNPLDNRRENLRIISNSGNNRNRKKISTDSKYYGVSWHTTNKKWRCQISIEQKTLHANYDEEEHAAWHYNLWIDEYKLEFAKKNEIKQPIDFVKWKPLEKKGGNLPKGISFHKERYYLRINIDKKRKFIGSYKTLEEAIQVKNDKIKELAKIENQKILDTPMLRNENGEAVIEIFNKNKEKICETIVDENIYHHLIRYKWNLNNYGYVMGRAKDKKLILLHRYLMKYNGHDFVDHINSNRLDNRIENLRIVNPQQNSQNKSTTKNSSSKYIGVFKKRNKWATSITLNGKNKHLGCFDDEIEAAKARDVATLEHFGEFGKYNFNIFDTFDDSFL